MADSISTQIRHVEQLVRRQVTGQDMADLPLSERKQIQELLRTAAEAKLDIREYEYAETRDEQVALVQSTKKRLEQVRTSILSLSGLGYFGPADVASITAHIEHITESIE